MFLGNAQKGSLDLTGALVEIENESRETRNSNQHKIKYIIKISTSNACTPFIVGTEHLEVAEEWKNLITETAHNASARVTIQFHISLSILYFYLFIFYIKETENKKMEQQLKIAKEISDLIIYCRAVTFCIETQRERFVYDEMSSFSETKAEKLMCHQEPEFFFYYHQKQFSRVFPKGQRIDSSNYMPIPLWNTGCQMTALNYQTPGLLPNFYLFIKFFINSINFLF